MKYLICLYSLSLFFQVGAETKKVSGRLIKEYELESLYNEKNPQTYLLSFPKSGNTWMRYSLEFLTKRPTLEKTPLAPMNIPLGITFEILQTNLKKPPIWKIHKLTDKLTDRERAYGPADEINYEQDYLIMIVRNYKEVFARLSKILNPIENFLTQPLTAYYFKNLEFFDSFPEDRRMIIYYEDFMTHPIETFIAILYFLEEPYDYLDEFMKNWDLHKKNAIKIYTKYDRVYTRGEQLIYHSTKLTNTQKRNLDNAIKKRYPNLWEQYLKRYAEA